MDIQPNYIGMTWLPGMVGKLRGKWRCATLLWKSTERWISCTESYHVHPVMLCPVYRPLQTTLYCLLYAIYLLLARYVPNVAKEEYMRSV